MYLIADFSLDYRKCYVALTCPSFLLHVYPLFLYMGSFCVSVCVCFIAGFGLDYRGCCFALTRPSSRLYMYSSFFYTNLPLTRVCPPVLDKGPLCQLSSTRLEDNCHSGILSSTNIGSCRGAYPNVAEFKPLAATGSIAPFLEL